MRYAALLRGVNLGKRRIGMADLRRLFEREGMDQVTTYLQSGNLVFTTRERSRERMRKRAEELIRAEFGFDVSVILVTAPELAEVIAGCPYREDADQDPTKVHVTFLEPMPPLATLEDIDLTEVAPEQMEVGRGVIYMHLPNGMGRASLPPVVEKRTASVIATTRNWRTVRALSELLAP